MLLSDAKVQDGSAPEGMGRVRLGECLVRDNKLSARDLEQALVAQQEMGDLLGRVLVRLGLVSEIDVAQALSRQLDIPFVAADDFPELMPEVEGLLPSFLQANHVFPLALRDGALHVAMATPQDPFSPYARTKLAVEWMIRDFLATR